MKFDKSRVYTSVNADILKPGDKVICANDMGHLKHYVTSNGAVLELKSILDENNRSRFVAGTGKVLFNLAYLVERKANCTNCGMKSECKDANIKNPEIHNCLMWEKPKTEQKSEMPELISLGNGQYAEKEKHYRPFKDTDELQQVWGSRCNEGKGYILNSLDMPHIWVKRKNFPKDKGTLITSFDEDIVYVGICQRTMDELLDDYTFLDGSVCGVEE